MKNLTASKHIGIVRESNGRVCEVRYLLSKFEREIVDAMVIDGIRFTVRVIGENRNSVIDGLNVIIRDSNKVVSAVNSAVRAEQKVLDAQANREFANIMAQVINDINNF